MRIIRGRGASPGVEYGPLYFHARVGGVVERREIHNAETEWQRFLCAQQVAVEQLNQLEQQAETMAGPESALLFETHQLMVQDDDYVQTIHTGIESGHLNAEAALYDAAAQFIRQFAGAESDYMKERADDIRDISRRIYHILTGSRGETFHCPQPSVLVVDELTPSEIIQMDRENIRGILMRRGAPDSHTAILARSLSLPMVICGEDLPELALAGHPAFIDGTTGQVAVDADEPTRVAMEQKRAREAQSRQLLLRLKGRQNVTLDGQKVDISCDIGLMDEVKDVPKSDGDGVGLFRSEFLYLRESEWPTEEEQFYAYRTVLGTLRRQTVTMRTMDIGCDRDVPYYAAQDQRNPSLGLRSLRVSLTRPDLFRTQLRALYRASVYGKLRIILPMVASVWEVREARLACKAAMAELDSDGYPYDPTVPLGILIETPSAVLMSDRLAEEVDFFSVGTIDLTQYLTACDRQSGQMGRFFDPHHPALLRAIRITVENAHKKGIPVAVCGELSSDLTMTETLLAIGVDELTVSPANVLPLREKVRSLDLSASREGILAAL